MANFYIYDGHHIYEKNVIESKKYLYIPGLSNRQNQ